MEELQGRSGCEGDAGWVTRMSRIGPRVPVRWVGPRPPSATFRRPEGSPRPWSKTHGDAPPERQEPLWKPGWHFPWPEPGHGTYDASGPGMGADVTFVLHGALFRVTATGDEGIHTGRPRYFVKCISCSETIHRNTTGPEFNIEGHLLEKHNIRSGGFARNLPP